MRHKPSEQSKLILSKIKARIKAIDLLSKHKAISPSTLNERSTLAGVEKHISNGGNYTIFRKGFVSTPYGTVVCLI